MADCCLLYYITDRSQFSGDEHARRHALLAKVAEAARARVDYIQLREKDLNTRELEILAREALTAVRTGVPRRTENRELRTSLRTRLLINSRTDVAVFAPVFEKRNTLGTQPASLAALREACRAKIPVLALGGVTTENAASCLDAGSAGIAGIRLFQENKIEDVVRMLRAL